MALKKKRIRPRSFVIRVRFSPHIKGGGYVLSDNRKTHYVVIWSGSSYVRMLLNVIHECLHVAFHELIDYIMPNGVFSITREHFIIDKVDVLLRNLIFRYLIRFERLK